MNWNNLERIQFIWFWGKPTFHWWAYPPDFSNPAFHGKPIMWRLGLGLVEVRFFPKRAKA